MTEDNSNEAERIKHCLVYLNIQEEDTVVINMVYTTKRVEEVVRVGRPMS